MEVVTKIKICVKKEKNRNDFYKQVNGKLFEYVDIWQVDSKIIGVKQMKIHGWKKLLSFLVVEF